MFKTLLIEDDEDQCAMLMLILGRSGFGVQSTNSAKAAVSILLQERFDIIISDLRLPEIDGKALTSLIRASAGPNQSVPIVILSAANKEEVSGLFEAGATLVLDKNNLSELGKKLLPLVAKS